MTLAQLIAALQALDVPGETEVVVEGEMSPSYGKAYDDVFDVAAREVYADYWGNVVTKKTNRAVGSRVVIWRY